MEAESSRVVNMHTGASGFHHKHVKPLDAYLIFTPSPRHKPDQNLCPYSNHSIAKTYLNPTLYALIKLYQLAFSLSRLY